MSDVQRLKIKPLDPNNAEVEAAVIGACLGAPAAFDRLQSRLDGEDFYEILYADVWRAMAEMAASNRRADLVTLAPALENRKVGDVAALDHLKVLIAVYGGGKRPDDETLDAYAAELRLYAAQRAMMRSGRALSDRAGSVAPDLTDIAATAIGELDEALVRARGGERTGASIGTYAATALAEYRDENSPSGLSTGLKTLDNMTGGLYRREVTILGGRPGSGKTSIAAQIQLNMARKGIGTLMVSLEMSGVSVAQRMLASEVYSRDTPLPYTLFRTDKLVRPEDRRISTRDLRRLDDAQARLDRYPFHIEEKAGLTVAEIGGLIRRTGAAYAKRGIELGFVVVDYLGLVKPTGRYSGQRVNEVGEISSGLRELAKGLNVHIMALHQLSRAVEQGDDKRPQLHHLRDSGTLEQDADLVLFAYREAYYLERQSYSDDPEREEKRLERLEKVKHLAEIIIAKQRAGIVGSNEYFCRIDCNYIKDLATER